MLVIQPCIFLRNDLPGEDGNWPGRGHAWIQLLSPCRPREDPQDILLGLRDGKSNGSLYMTRDTLTMCHILYPPLYKRV
jgi:hypothetical protein